MDPRGDAVLVTSEDRAFSLSTRRRQPSSHSRTARRLGPNACFSDFGRPSIFAQYSKAATFQSFSDRAPAGSRSTRASAKLPVRGQVEARLANMSTCLTAP
jgi:hypothetical protein